jgi:ribose transport system permease protein
MSDVANTRTDAPARRSVSPHVLLERSGLGLLLIMLFVLFALEPTSRKVFLTSANINLILGNYSVTALIGLAMVVPLTAGNFDLSAAAVAGGANVAIASLIGEHHVSVVLSIVIGCLVGVALGFVNGGLVAGCGFGAFIVTLGTYTLIGGIIQWYTSGITIVGIPPSVSSWGLRNWIGLPRPFILLIVVAALLWYWLMHTPQGRYLEAIGSNPSAARLVGLPTRRLIWMSFVVSGLIAGIAGALLTVMQGGASPTAGPAYLFPAVTAVFLGATTIRPGRYNIWGTVLGTFFVAVAVSGLSLLGASTWVQPVFDGGALIVAVGISTIARRSRDKREEATTRSGLLEPVTTRLEPADAGREAPVQLDGPLVREPTEG